MKLIFDSNIFDDLVSGNLSLNHFKRSRIKIYVTHIQIDEVNKCADVEKRARLFQLMIEANVEKIPTESFIVGTSRIGSAKISDGITIEKLRKGNLSRTNDALIGETAIKTELILITNDLQLKNTVVSLGGAAMNVDDLKKHLLISGNSSK